jgi:hypothetical protein
MPALGLPRAPRSSFQKLSGKGASYTVPQYLQSRALDQGAGDCGHAQGVNLAAARLRHIAGTAWSTKRYLNIGLLKDQQMRGAIAA